MTQATNPDNRSFGEAAVLTNLFGDSPRVKILAVLLKEGRDINATEIADRGGMSRSSVYENIDPLITIGVVEQTREIGGSPLYRIKKDSEVAVKLKQLEMELVHEIAGNKEDDDFEIPACPPTE